MVKRLIMTIISFDGRGKMEFSLNGKFKDLLYSHDGELINEQGWCSNTIVYNCLDLVAELLMNKPKMGGILYWAVGEGREEWDRGLPESDPNTKKLVKEIYRKRIDSSKDIIYHRDRKTLEIKTEFRLDEAVGPLRELGLFGGNATSELNTGYMINYKTHQKIVKTKLNVLKRKLFLSLALTPFFRSEIEAIEGIDEKFGAKLRLLEPPIITLEDLSRIDETKAKVSGVSRARLKLWKDMATLMTSIEGLDRNGAEILAKGGGISTSQELSTIDSPDKFRKFYNKCIEATKSIKLPANYVKEHFTQEKVRERIKIATLKRR